MEEEVKSGAQVEESKEVKSEEQSLESVGKEAVAEEKKEESAEQKPTAKEVVAKEEYDKIVKEHGELQKLYGRQANELGELRIKKDAVREAKKELTVDERLTLMATDPDKYEEYLSSKIQEQLLAKTDERQRVQNLEKEVSEKYPELKDFESPLFKETEKIIKERPRAFSTPESFLVAAELAKAKLMKPEELIEKGKKEALDNVKSVSRETAMETKKSAAVGGKTKVEEMLGRTMTEKEEKFLKTLGVSVDKLDEEISFSKVSKGGK